MISDSVLALAVDRGLLTAAQVEELRALARETAPVAAAQEPPPLPSPLRYHAAEPDDEQLRFVTGFADIFVTLGLALFFGAAAYLINFTFTGATLWAIIALLAWILAEFFTRRRRMALPSIVLLDAFCDRDLRLRRSPHGGVAIGAVVAARMGNALVVRRERAEHPLGGAGDGNFRQACITGVSACRSLLRQAPRRL